METGIKERLSYSLFGNAPGAGRQVYLDILRVIATIFVICVHTVSLASSMILPGSRAFMVLEILNFVFLSCNLLFVMISGALLLPTEGEPVKNFFTRRFSKVAVPLAVYYILYICAKEGIEWIFPDHWLPLLLRILSGPPEEAPHFWLIYVILFLYLLTPFLRRIVHHIPDSVLRGIIVAVFLVNGLQIYGPLFGIDAHLSVIVDSFAGVFLLGYFLAQKAGRRTENFMIAAGFLSFVGTCICIVLTDSYQSYIFNSAPTMMLFASAIFLIVKRYAKERVKESLFTRLVGRYSFSILLIHWGILHFAVKQILRVDVLSGGIWGGCLLMIVLTFLLSALGAVLIDNTLILALRVLFNRLAGILKKKM